MKPLALLSDFAHITLEDLKAATEPLGEYRSLLCEIAESGVYEKRESSICLPSDKGQYERVLECAQRYQGAQLKYVIVVGIGGSNLGAKAVYEAMRTTTDWLTDRHPKLVFVDTLNSRLVQQAIGALSKCAAPEEFVVNVISKSGLTTETIANLEVLYRHITKMFGDKGKERMVATTDEGSSLARVFSSTDAAHLSIPGQVGGRYSVFSAVGLFPLALAGLDIGMLLRGAREMRDLCLRNKKIEKNPALHGAALLYEHHRREISISNTFFFDPELESVGKWYRQLMAESIGKGGGNTSAGITPIVSVGSTDLHSMIQLYLGGPRDKFTTFVYPHRFRPDERVPERPAVRQVVEGIAGKRYSEIMLAILEGVKAAYRKRHIPFAEVMLPEVNEFYLGQYLQMKMIEMMYLAKLLGVNAFDQPDVEAYKEETRKLLES